MDPNVIAALELALRTSPADVALRAHLVTLLLESDRNDEAMQHGHALLYFEPDSLQGLALCATASDRIGKPERAEAYRRLINALQGNAVAPMAMNAETPLATEDEIDAFLSTVFNEASPKKRVTLDDVGGLEDVKKRLRTSFLEPMRNEAMRKMYGNSLRGGLLLWGPPGCGKTFLARAVAGELDANFLSVGLHQILDMWLGNSEKNVHAIFERARKLSPCVLFFDEVDAIGMKRTDLNGSARRDVIAQLLEELDGIESDNDGVFVLGATNAPWDIDAALRRPGRFDRTMLILPPDEAARASIIEYHLRERPADDIDVAAIAQRTLRYSGADLRLLCQSAAESAMGRAVESGIATPIENNDFANALGDTVPSTGPWFGVANNFAMFANRSGEYDELLKYIKKHKLA